VPLPNFSRADPFQRCALICAAQEVVERERELPLAAIRWREGAVEMASSFYVLQYNYASNDPSGFALLRFGYGADPEYISRSGLMRVDS
jgi:hypothetical protein